MRDRVFDGSRFRALRKKRDLTVAALATRAGVSQAFIKYLESRSTQPSDPYAEVLADALDCTVEAFSDPKPDKAGAA